MKRRKFIKLAGSAMMLASLPVAARVLDAQEAPQSFGGPTPNSEFYVTSYGSTPTVDVSKWNFTITGLVKRPLSFSYEDIKRMPSIKEELTLECIGNPPNGTAIGNAIWTGPKLKPLLDRAGVKSNAVYAAIHGADGYYTGIPLDEIMRDANFLPYLMNGVPLPPVHGYPLRVFIPGKYGMKQPKWLTRIEFVDREFIGYWEARGWSNEAWRKVNSGFFYPEPTASLFDLLTPTAKTASPVEIVGWALAGPSGIRRVQVTTDGGKSWHDATLDNPVSHYVWTVWRYRFAPSRPGSFDVRVRATDGNGTTQPESYADTSAGATSQPMMRLDITSVA